MLLSLMAHGSVGWVVSRLKPGPMEGTVSQLEKRSFCESTLFSSDHDAVKGGPFGYV